MKLTKYLYEQLNERYRNFIGFDADTKKEREKYADDVWDMLQTAYKPIGGIKGNGFNSKREMINKIPFWKLYFSDGVLKYVKMYKDKGGRKSVALGTDGSVEAMDTLKKDIEKGMGREWAEQSKAALVMTYKVIGDDLGKYAISVNKVRELLVGDDIIPYIGNEDKTDKSDELTLQKIPEKYHKYFYLREIGGHLHLKMAIGTPRKHIFH